MRPHSSSSLCTCARRRVMRHDPGSQTCPRSTGPLGPCNLSATATCTCVHTHTLSRSLSLSLSHVCLSVDCRMFWIIGTRFPDAHLLSVRLLWWVLEGGSIYIYIHTYTYTSTSTCTCTLRVLCPAVLKLFRKRPWLLFLRERHIL